MVGRAGGNRDRLPRAEAPLSPVDDEPQRARDDLGSALLVGVDVQRLDDAARRIDGLDPQQLAVRVGTSEEEAHALAGARVADLSVLLAHGRTSGYADQNLGY